MTDRIRHITVTLDRDLREDDAEATLAAIKQIRGVADVVPHLVSGTDHIARSAVRNELYGQVIDAVRGIFYPELKK